MSDYIGEASVKITGDVKPLQEAVNKVEQIVAPLKNKELEGFKINYEGKEFESFQAYTEEINRQQAEWEEYISQQQEVQSATRETASSVSQLNEAIVQNTSESTQNTSALGNLADSVKNFGYAIEGSFLRTKESINEAGRLGRTVLIGLSASFVALGKSSLKEYAKYNDEAAQAQNRLEQSLSKVKASLGSLASPLLQAVAGIAEWASNNQKLVAGAATVVGVLAGSAGLIALITKLTLSISALKVAAGGIIGVLSLVAGVVVGLATEQQDFNNTLATTNSRLEEEKQNAEKLSKGYKQMTDTIADAHKQMAEATDNYRQSLKKVLVDHESTVASLNEQIKEANKDYKRAIEERNAAFLVSQAKEEEAHQNKVDELMTQLNFLQRYNNAYNKEKLEAVKFALAREEALYKKRTQAEKDELDLQNAYEKQKRDEKIAAYEQELETERQFLQKHAELFASVRDVMLRDEVENLQKSYNSTIENLNKTTAGAIQQYKELVAEVRKGQSVTMSQFEEINRQIMQFGDEGQRKVAQLEAKLITVWKDLNYYIRNSTISLREFNEINQKIIDSTDDESIRRVAELSQRNQWRGYAEGGYTGQGSENEIAGVVHRGEYVLPKDMVDQTTGTPKISGGGNITINLSGTFATSESERRKVAQQIVEAIRQTNYARLGV